RSVRALRFSSGAWPRGPQRAGIRSPRSALPRNASAATLASRSRQSIANERHQIDELHLVVLRGCARPFQHDRTERTRRDNGPGSCLPELPESNIADPRSRLFFFVGKQQPAACAAAVRVVTIPDRFRDAGSESRQQFARLIDLPTVTREITRVVI